MQYINPRSIKEKSTMEINSILTQVGNELFTSVMKELAVVFVSACTKDFD